MLQIEAYIANFYKVQGTFGILFGYSPYEIEPVQRPK